MEDVSRRSSVSGWIAAISVAVLWGITGVVAKPLSLVLDTVTLVILRNFIACFSLLVIFIATRKNDSLNNELGSSLIIKKNDILLIIFCGIVGQGFYAYFNFLSLNYIGATENGIIQGLQPFATVLYGMMFMNYRMNRQQWIAFTLSLVCIVLLNFDSSGAANGNNTLLGLFFAMVSMLSLAWTVYLRSKLSEKYGSVVSMFYQYIAVTIFGFILVPVLGADLSKIAIVFSSPKLIGLLIILGTGVSAISYVLQLYSFKEIGIEKSTMTLNLMPLIGYVMAVITLGESVTILKTGLILLIIVLLFIFNKYES